MSTGFVSNQPEKAFPLVAAWKMLPQDSNADPLALLPTNIHTMDIKETTCLNPPPPRTPHLPGPPPTAPTLKDLNSAITTGWGSPPATHRAPGAGARGSAPATVTGPCGSGPSRGRSVSCSGRGLGLPSVLTRGGGGGRPQASLPAARAMMSWNLLKPPEPLDVPPPALLSSFPTTKQGLRK